MRTESCTTSIHVDTVTLEDVEDAVSDTGFEVSRDTEAEVKADVSETTAAPLTERRQVVTTPPPGPAGVYQLGLSMSRR